MFKQLGHLILEKLDLYLNESVKGKGKVLIQNEPRKISEGLDVISFVRNGNLSKENLFPLVDNYLKNTQHMHHPHYMGHQVSTPHPASAFADMIHGLVNNPMAIYEMGPAAATIEKIIINWMLEKTGWFKAKDIDEFDNKNIGGGGILTHGGSLANLTCLLSARAKADPDAWEKGVSKDLVILCPEVSHYSVARSVSVMGMGSDKVIPVQVDPNEIIIVNDLIKKYKQLKENGKQVMAVVANGCATATGLYDPIDEIAGFCNENKLWFHVDGAHGAGALLSDNEKHLLKGIGKADSMIWDAHKMLRTSTLCAAALFKNYKNLDQTFRQKGSYIYFDKEQVGFDVISNSVECTKAGIGTKLFWVLAAEGEKGLTTYVESRYNLAKEVYNLIKESDHFRCDYVPESNIVCFLYTKHGSENEKMLKLRNEIVKRGNFYITTAIVNNQRYLRLSLMNPHTDLKHITVLFEEIKLTSNLIF